jgi:Mg2+/Co2+ transporter CorB
MSKFQFKSSLLGVVFGYSLAELLFTAVKSKLPISFWVYAGVSLVCLFLSILVIIKDVRDGRL